MTSCHLSLGTSTYMEALHILRFIEHAGSNQTSTCIVLQNSKIKLNEIISAVRVILYFYCREHDILVINLDGTVENITKFPLGPQYNVV